LDVFNGMLVALEADRRLFYECRAVLVSGLVKPELSVASAARQTPEGVR